LSVRIKIAAAAEVDLIVAADWYDRQAPGLGDSFVAQVDAVFEQLRHHPEMYQLVFAPVRRAVLHRFPFAVIYRVRSDGVEVLGVMPCRADPALLMQRLSAIHDQ
jgi:plasmid stabilization system protein ParE